MVRNGITHNPEITGGGNFVDQLLRITAAIVIYNGADYIFTSKFAASGKMINWIIGNANIMARIVLSLNICRNSFCNIKPRTFMSV
jgi:hypothetical protein